MKNTKDLPVWLKLLAAISMVSGLIACGGGGGSSGSGPSSIPTSYAAAAAPGELVTYNIDTAALTYSYTITESQYGLTNQTGSGTLTRVANNVYTLSGIPNSTIAVLPNGMMTGSIRHNFGAGLQTVPVMGISNPVSSVAALAGTYNYISRGCSSISACASYIGTLQLTSGGNWTFCSGGNGSGCTLTGGGTLQALGSGKFAAYDGGTLVGTLFATSSGGQNVVLIDLKDSRSGPTSLGKGLVVASSQAAINTALTNGSWVASGSTGNWGTFNLNNTTITYTSLNGSAISSSSTGTLDSPWLGLVTTSSGGSTYRSLLAGYGVYVSAGPSGYIELGIKYQ